MKDLDKVYAEHIAEEYAPKNESKVVALKKLDRKVKKPVEMFAYIFGTVSTLVLGTGMCFSMGTLGDGSLPIILMGVAIGIVGIIGAVINYPIYKKWLESRKKQYANDIITLAKSITE